MAPAPGPILVFRLKAMPVSSTTKLKLSDGGGEFEISVLFIKAYFKFQVRR